MAGNLTRIKNNQVTDAAAGNTQVGINAGTKVQNYSITAGKIANNLTYGSDLTITGNLTVQGTTTAVNTVNTVIQDPLLVLADGQTSGSPAVDIGYVGLRGSQNSAAFVWKESASEFVTALTTTDVGGTNLSNTTITVSSYANLHSGNTIHQGTTSLVGNLIGAVNATATITGGNLATPGTASATGTVTGGNLATGGTASATGNITGGNVLTGGVVSAAGNIIANPASYFIGNGSQLTGVAASSAGFPVSLGTTNISAISSGNIYATIGGTPNVVVWATTGSYISGLNSVTGNITGGNLATAGTASATGTITGGNLATGGTASATGNITGGNVLTGGLVSATATITGGNLATGGTASATGTVTGGNLATGGTVSATGAITGASTISATGTITGGNLATGGTASATGNITGGNVLTGGLVSATANITGGNVLTGGLISATGNISGANVNATGNIVPTANVTYSLGSPTAQWKSLYVSGNTIYMANLQLQQPSGQANTLQLTGSDGSTLGGINISTLSATGNITGGNLNTGGQVVATANITGGNLATGGTASVTGNITGGNVLTGGLISATATITGGNLATGGTLSVAGNVTGGGSSTFLIQNTTQATAALTGAVQIYGGASISKDLWVSGNIFAANIYGTQANIITVEDPLLYLQPNGNVTYPYNYDIGIYSAFTGGAGNTYQHTAFFRDFNTGIWNLASNIAEPAGTTLIIDANTVYDAFKSGAITSTATISAVGNITGGNLITGGLFSAGGNVIGGNLTTAGQVSATANITGGNVLTGGLVSATATITGGNLATGGTASATGTITGGNLATGGTASATGNITGGNILTAGLMSSTGNATHGNVLTGGVVSAAGNIIANPASYFIGNGSQLTGVAASSAGFPVSLGTTNISAISSGNIYATIGGTPNVVVWATTGSYISGLSSVTGNITGGNVLTGGLISATATITGGNLATGGTASATGNITGGNVLTGGLISATATITGGNLATAGTVSATGAITGASTISATGTVTGGNLATGGTTSATGNITGGNVLTGGLVSATATITGGNLATGGTASATGNITGGNVLTGGLISATGAVYGVSFVGNVVATTVSATANITGGNIITAGIISTSGNIYGGNLSVSGVEVDIGNITGGNLLTGGQVSATGNVQGGNVVITGNAVNMAAAGGTLILNSANANTNFAVNGTAANVFFVNAATNSVSFGSSTQTTNAVAAFNTTTSVLMPVGNTAQRPGTGVTGMMRFNTTGNYLEIFDNTKWIAVAAENYTVIADEQFSGDGTTTAFTLSSNAQTTNSCLVSINGVVQVPVTAYAVSGTTMTFTEAPAAGDLIDVREITTTTSISSISNSSGNASIYVNDQTSNVSVTGNLVASGTIFAQTLNITTTESITGNIIGGNVNTVGQVSATGNITGNYFIGNGSGLTGLSASKIFNGTSEANIGSSGGNITFTIGGTAIAGISTAGIYNAQANGVGNIGSSSTYFNTVFAKATSAQYADLAEMYAGDAAYEPGTVVDFGGDQEVTISTKDMSSAVAGVVSTNPSYLMNSSQTGDNVVAVALTGRVPTKVTGPVSKGDLMVSNGDGTARAEESPAVGTIIGKALANFDGDVGVIEVVVGRV